LEALLKLLSSNLLIIRSILIFQVVFFSVHEHALIITFSLRLEEPAKVELGSRCSAH
jgi:hypothetical protein